MDSKSEFLKQAINLLYFYNSETGHFKWKCKLGSAAINSIAGTSHDKGYVIIRVLGKRYYAHRLVWLIEKGVLPTTPIDHINNNQSDNRISNLRAATSSQNSHNSIRPKNNTSGIKGVSYSKKGLKNWLSQVTVKKEKYSRLFDNKEEAEKWVIEKRKEIHKQFANHGT